MTGKYTKQESGETKKGDATVYGLASSSNRTFFNVSFVSQCRSSEWAIFT